MPESRPQTRFVAGFFRGCNILEALPAAPQHPYPGRAILRPAQKPAKLGDPLDGIR